MRTYQVYVANTTNRAAPTIIGAFLRAEKYKDAWEIARALCNGKATRVGFTSDEKGEKPFKLAQSGDGVTVAQILEMKARNVKFDASALREIMDDKSLNEAQKLAKIAALSA